jgi:predicted ribosome quality control (RQC) complex YloA/Tae2 family protein
MNPPLFYFRRHLEWLENSLKDLGKEEERIKQGKLVITSNIKHIKEVIGKLEQEEQDGKSKAGVPSSPTPSK